MITSEGKDQLTDNAWKYDIFLHILWTAIALVTKPPFFFFIVFCSLLRMKSFSSFTHSFVETINFRVKTKLLIKKNHDSLNDAVLNQFQSPINYNPKIDGIIKNATISNLWYCTNVFAQFHTNSLFLCAKERRIWRKKFLWFFCFVPKKTNADELNNFALFFFLVIYLKCVTPADVCYFEDHIGEWSTHIIIIKCSNCLNYSWHLMLLLLLFLLQLLLLLHFYAVTEWNLYTICIHTHGEMCVFGASRSVRNDKEVEKKENKYEKNVPLCCYHFYFYLGMRLVFRAQRTSAVDCFCFFAHLNNGPGCLMHCARCVFTVLVGCIFTVESEACLLMHSEIAVCCYPISLSLSVLISSFFCCFIFAFISLYLMTLYFIFIVTAFCFA